jgi:hypothetical protein
MIQCGSEAGSVKPAVLGSSAVCQNLDAGRADQLLIGRDKRQIEDLRRRREKVVGRITMRQVDGQLCGIGGPGDRKGRRQRRFDCAKGSLCEPLATLSMTELREC